ncbi:MAG: hypothetical protein ACI91R_001326, partial [Vicingaceae bacterium]
MVETCGKLKNKRQKQKSKPIKRLYELTSKAN